MIIRIIYTFCFLILNANFLVSKEVNVFSSRHYESDYKLYDFFTKKTGIKVNVITGKSKLLEKRIIEEGSSCKGDLLILADAGRMGSAENKGLFQKFNSSVLKKKIPENLRTDYWYSIAKRARIFFYNNENIKNKDFRNIDYLDLADEKWDGDILIRASNNIYNQSLVAYMIEVYGEKKATEWVRGLVKNMARSPQGNDRAQILGVAAKEGKIAVANTYYHSLMMSGKKGTGQKKAAEKVSPIFPGQNSKGTHINISGAGLLKHSPNKRNAIKLLEFFLSDKAQKHIVNNTFEYPISKNVNPHPLVSRMGTNFKENNSISISSYFKWQSKAYKIMLENGWK